MNKKEVKEALIKSIKKFIQKDWKELYGVNIYENTYSHRIAVYLEENFKKYNVDCEYNKLLGDKKVNGVGEKIRPDIIIHKRCDMKCNKLIIEIKKAGVRNQKFINDIIKLKKSYNLNYNLGAIIGILKYTIDLVLIESENVIVQIRFKNNGEEISQIEII